MSNKPKISIIIPCYKTEKYIKQCIDSVINQTLQDIEIICVNDGSPDGTLAILNEYAQSDNRITVIDKPNGGYGQAMNAGMLKASGDYIGIVESDDFIIPIMYETLIGKSRNGTVDIVKSNFYNYYDKKGNPIEMRIDGARNSMNEIEEPFIVTEHPDILLGHPSIWSAIYRHDFLSEINIRFMEAKGGGWVDNPFFYETMLKAKSIVYINEPLYYYRKTADESSSTNLNDPTLPITRMNDNLDVIDNISVKDTDVLRMAYARALQYMRGTIADGYYGNNFDLINSSVMPMFRRLDSNIILNYFKLQDQQFYSEFASPIYTKQISFPKILIYNSLPFDNLWNLGGNINLYCKNLVETILKESPLIQIYFLSSGFTYKTDTTEIFFHKIPNIFDERVQQFEIVNSPAPANHLKLYGNPSIAIKSAVLKNVLHNFLKRYGPFEAIHINGLAGLSLDCLDLKDDFPSMRFIFTIHNYELICVTGLYFTRHKPCSPKHTDADCFRCYRKNAHAFLSKDIYERGCVGVEADNRLLQSKWVNSLSLNRLDEDITKKDIHQYSFTAIKKINKNFDSIIAVSNSTYNISVGEFINKNKLTVMYSGVKAAKSQIRQSNTSSGSLFKIVYLGGDLNCEEAGYPWLLDSLEQLPYEYAVGIDLLFTVNQAEYAGIFKICENFHSVTVRQGYTYDELKNILKGCHLGIVPALWNENLPNIAVEMVAFGVPVLASDAGGAIELCDCNLFTFESGNTNDFIKKLLHFIDNPIDLQLYWHHHNGLPTMERHWVELKKHYNLCELESVSLSPYDWHFLLLERDFLRKNILINEERFTPQNVIDDLQRKINECNNEINHLQSENERLKMENFNGKIIFKSNLASEIGSAGIPLFKIILEDSAWNNFYAIIQFSILKPAGEFHTNILRVSGTITLDKLNGEQSFILHQLDWREDDPEVPEYICFYIEGYELFFFTLHPGIRTSAVTYEIMMINSRRLTKAFSIMRLHGDELISRVYAKPKEAFNTITEWETLKNAGLIREGN